MKNILAIIGAVTVVRWGYKLFRVCVDHQVAKEVMERQSQTTFNVPS